MEVGKGKNSGGGGGGETRFSVIESIFNYFCSVLLIPMSKKKMPWPYLSTKVHDSIFHIFAICQLVCFSSVLESLLLFYVT